MQAAENRGCSELARTLLKGEQHLSRTTAMTTKTFSPRSFLDKAILASVGAMLAMNVLVLAQQLDHAPAFAAAAPAAVQA
jgi:hypothetical protein